MSEEPERTAAEKELPSSPVDDRLAQSLEGLREELVRGTREMIGAELVDVFDVRPT